MRTLSNKGGNRRCPTGGKEQGCALVGCSLNIGQVAKARVVDRIVCARMPSVIGDAEGNAMLRAGQRCLRVNAALCQ